MNEELRLRATKYIWVAFFFTILVTNANVLGGQTPGIENVIMTGIIALAATGSSITLWTTTNAFTSEDVQADTKLKRGERVKRLIDLMDEDELYELRQRLSDDYSEPPTDYMTLGDDGELQPAKIKLH